MQPKLAIFKKSWIWLSLLTQILGYVSRIYLLLYYNDMTLLGNCSMIF